MSSDARGYALTMQGTLNRRAGRKLDASSVAVVADAAADLLHELEVQGRVIEEKDARIEQAERHNQQLRETNDRLLLTDGEADARRQGNRRAGPGSVGIR